MVTNSAVTDGNFSAGHVFQVLVVGGGISGTIAATVLSRAGYNVCLFDRYAEYPRDFRAEHLDGLTVDILQRLGLLENLTLGLSRGETVHLARNGRVIGSAETLNFGLRYETLVNRARSLLPRNVTVVTGRVVEISTTSSVQQVRLADGRGFSGRLVVLATGQGFGLCKQLGFRRRFIREQHSLTFGFDINPLAPVPFPHSFIVYQREHVRHRIDYFAAFTLAGRTRVNLFTYRDYREPWTKALIADPDPGLHAVLPRLEHVIGPYRAVGPVEARPVDLYASENYARDGVVVIGDAFQSACPATGMGMFRLLTDIEQLSTTHVPRWFNSPGMETAKIASFYRDPVKRACDAKALHDSEYRRSVSTKINLRWNVHRLRVGAMEQVQAWCHRLPTSSQPRINQRRSQASLAAS